VRKRSADQNKKALKGYYWREERWAEMQILYLSKMLPDPVDQAAPQND